MDLPKEQENAYITQHFDKLDKDMAYIIKASKTTEVLTNSITFMEALRKMEDQQKKLRKNVVSGVDSALPKPVYHEAYLPPYLLINKNAILQSNETIKNASGLYKDAHNERAQR